MKYFIPLLLLVGLTAHAQEFRPLELKTSIDYVTVFLDGAEITRSGSKSLESGKTIISLKSLSPHINPKSVQVKGEGTFTILSVNHRLNYLNKLKKTAKIDKLKIQISENESRLEVLKEKQSLLNVNKNLNTETRSIPLAQLQETLRFYEKQLMGIKSEELEVSHTLQDLRLKLAAILKHMDKVENNKELPTGEIEIRVEATAKTNGEFSVSYLVANAGWFPKYDVRVENVEQPLSLKYKASVYQNTGIDWKNVSLTFSNANPNESGVAPKLSTWYLNYARNAVYKREDFQVNSYLIRNVSGHVVDAEMGDALPGINVVVKGTTIGTVTDINGNYSLTLPNNASRLVFSFIGLKSKEVPINSSVIDVRLSQDVTQLSEVVVTGVRSRASGIKIRGYSSMKETAKSVSTTTVENQTTVEFEVDRPYSIKSNGEALTVELKTYEADAYYQYYAVPKLDRDAFLIARVVNWDKYNLLEGEANLYLEGSFVGKSILDAKSLTDTLDISLGRDKSIVIGRTKMEDFSKRQTIGGKKTASRTFKILVRNKKRQPVNLTLFDQIPISAISDIEVTAEELSQGNFNEKTGEVKWDLAIEPQQQRELQLSYEVKYPKGEQVILE